MERFEDKYEIVPGYVRGYLVAGLLLSRHGRVNPAFCIIKLAKRQHALVSDIYTSSIIVHPLRSKTS